jgi:hypothetical protein
MSSMIGDKLKKGGGEGGPPSQTHPQGAVLAMLEAIKKAAQQMAKIDEGMAPYVNRALSILEQGVGEVISKKKPGAGDSPEGSPMEMPGGGDSKAPSEGGGFPG